MHGWFVTTKHKPGQKAPSHSHSTDCPRFPWRKDIHRVFDPQLEIKFKGMRCFKHTRILFRVKGDTTNYAHPAGVLHSCPRQTRTGVTTLKLRHVCEHPNQELLNPTFPWKIRKAPNASPVSRHTGRTEPSRPWQQGQLLSLCLSVAPTPLHLPGCHPPPHSIPQPSLLTATQGRRQQSIQRTTTEGPSVKTLQDLVKYKDKFCHQQKYGFFVASCGKA